MQFVFDNLVKMNADKANTILITELHLKTETLFEKIGEQAVLIEEKLGSIKKTWINAAKMQHDQS